jgi:acetylornithine deacetylase/succinyl-diaminopimelate desuccinylase-like protein
MAEFLAGFFRRHRAEVRLVRVEPGRPNLIARFAATGKPKVRICFAPHTDTVSVAGMTIDPFKPVVRGGKLYGRGTSDTKGSLAAMAVAAAGHYRRHPHSQIELIFAGLMGEEAGSVGAHHYAKSCPAFDLVIAGEPTGMHMVHAHKGVAWFEISAAGRACHASMPGKGVNAITRLADALGSLEKELRTLYRQHRHPLLGSPTYNLGLIQGGSKPNIVPDHASAQVDLRLTPSLTLPDAETHVRRILKGSGSGLKCRSLGGFQPLLTPRGTPILKKVLPATTGFAIAPWCCDAAVFASKGLPSIAMGPGSISQAHTADEWIALEDLEDGTLRFAALLEKLEAASS